MWIHLLLQMWIHTVSFERCLWSPTDFVSCLFSHYSDHLPQTTYSAVVTKNISIGEKYLKVKKIRWNDINWMLGEEIKVMELTGPQEISVPLSPLHLPPQCPPLSARGIIWQQWALAKASRSSHSAVELLSSSDPQIMEMRGWMYSTKIPYRDSFSLFSVRKRSKGNCLISIPKETKTPRALSLLQSNNKHPSTKKIIW